MFLKMKQLEWLTMPISGLVVMAGVATSLIGMPPEFGPAWKWADNPLTTMSQNKALVCVQVTDGRAGVLQMQTLNSSGELGAVVFWDNQMGHCTMLTRDQLGNTWLLPQRQYMFLDEVSVTTWGNGLETRKMVAEAGGWPVQ